MPEEPKSFVPVTHSRVTMLTEATDQFRSHLDLALPALERRGINEEVASTSGLGVVPDDSMPGFDHYRGKLAIPYYVGDGVVQIRFRCLSGMASPVSNGHDCKALGHSKYLTMAGDSARMYNVNNVRDADDTIHVCEGELDAVILNMLGYPAVALPGALQWQWRHTILLSGFNNIFIWSDPDEAGAEMRNEVMRHLPRAKPVALEHGDVGETYLAIGEMGIEMALDRAMSVG